MGKKIHDLLVLGKSFDCTKNKCATTFLGESSSSLFDYILPRLLLDDFIAKMVCSRPNNVLQTFDLWLREFCLAVKAPLAPRRANQNSRACFRPTREEGRTRLLLLQIRKRKNALRA